MRVRHAARNQHHRRICIGETIFLGSETERPKSHSSQKRFRGERNAAAKARQLRAFGRLREICGSKDCVVDLGGLERSNRLLSTAPFARTGAAYMQPALKMLFP